MKPSLLCRRLSVAVFLACLGRPSAALATSTKAACIDAFDRAQQERRAGQLKIAREDLLVCSRQACPSMLRADCADMLRQVEAAQPTIVLKAVDAKGADVTDVSVDLNGKRLVSSLDGRAIAVDPGKLSLVFARPPAKPVTVTVMIGEGEKSHIVQANLEPLAAPTTSTPPGSDPDDRTRPRAIRSVAGWAVPGGFAALGAAAFAYAGITRLSLESEANDLRRTCGPTCLQEDRDRLSGELVTVNIMLGVAITSVALAAASWFVLGPKNAGGRTRTAGSAW